MITTSMSERGNGERSSSSDAVNRMQVVRIPSSTTRKPSYRPTGPTLWATSTTPAGQPTSANGSTRRKLQSITSYSNLRLENIDWLPSVFNDFGPISINGTNYRVTSEWKPVSFNIVNASTYVLILSYDLSSGAAPTKRGLRM